MFAPVLATLTPVDRPGEEPKRACPALAAPTVAKVLAPLVTAAVIALPTKPEKETILFYSFMFYSKNSSSKKKEPSSRRSNSPDSAKSVINCPELGSSSPPRPKKLNKAPALAPKIDVV